MKKVKIDDICTIQTGKFDVNIQVPNGLFNFFTCAIEPLKSSSYSFDCEAILLPGNGANVGKVLYYNGKFEAYQRTYVLNNFNCHPKYVYYYFKSKWEKQVLGNQYGSATNYIRLDNISELQIPLPPLSEQKKIAAILDKADFLRQKRKEAIDKLDKFVQAVFLDMFGDPVTNPKGWEVKKIEDVSESIISGPFGSNLKKECYTDKGYRIYGQEQVIPDNYNVGDYYISKSKFDELKRYEVRENDILISLVGSYGKISIVPKNIEPGIINPRLMRIRLDRSICNPLYLKYILYSKSMKRELELHSHGGTMGILNTSNIRTLKIPIPPIEMQNQFEKAIQSIFSYNKDLSSSQMKSNSLFNSLLQRAFKGELKFNDKAFRDME